MLQHLFDLAAMSERQNRGIDSDFLTPEEYSEFRHHEQEFSEYSVKVYSEDQERKLLHFGPGSFQVAILRIDSKSHAFVKLQHPDYLGALIGLGLDRKVLGDILPDDRGAYLFVKESMAPFILDQLTSVGRASVSVSRRDDLPEEAQPKRQERELVVSSLRIDSMVAAFFRLSRGKAQKAIRSGFVFVDGGQELGTTTLLKEGNRVSLRHGGKFRYCSALRRTKKNSYVVLIEEYQ